MEGMLLLLWQLYETNTMTLCTPLLLTTTPQPFYGPFSGTPWVSRCQGERLDFMVQGKINRERQTDHLGGRHSVRTKQCPPPSSPMFFTGRMPFLPPNQQCQRTEGNMPLLLRGNKSGNLKIPNRSLSWRSLACSLLNRTNKFIKFNAIAVNKVCTKTSGQRIMMRCHTIGEIFHWENLMCHSTASVAGKSECSLTARGEIPTLGPLRMVLSGMRENPNVIPFKSAHSHGGSGPHLIYSFLGSPKSISQMASQSVQPLLQGSWLL